ncbi:MAG: DNA helicase [Chromatiales bacterium]|jgi:replicative DNA helicase|nr:DNA helicase [Chromatiales bacterium]
MKLSAPIYRLKCAAKHLSREPGIPLHEALDRIAVDEGFSRWSLLSNRIANMAPSKVLFARLDPGDLVLLAARPGHGKTLMGLELTIEAMKSGRHGVIFNLEYGEADILAVFKSIGEDPAAFNHRFRFDCSDAISADYIMERLRPLPRGTVAVIDYLQVLDQKRDNPELMDQVTALKSFADSRGLILVFISQIHRSFNPCTRACPGEEDVRLPNPLDLSLFNKKCFLHDGEVKLLDG